MRGKKLLRPDDVQPVACSKARPTGPLAPHERISRVAESTLAKSQFLSKPAFLSLASREKLNPLLETPPALLLLCVEGNGRASTNLEPQIVS